MKEMRKIITLLSCLACLQLSAQITTYNISRSISCTDTIQPFAANTNSYGISIDGEGQLLSDTAFIRVVLVDNNDDEWLVYECNSLYATEENAQFQGAAFETAALDNINPQFVIVTLCDASFYLASITNNRTVTSRNDVLAVSDSVFLTKNLQIVDRINAKLSAYKKAWRADTTFLSNLRYQERKAMFGDEMPNLQGWDYFAYGYYSPLNDNTPPASDNIVKEFDWRTRHGSQNSGTYYYNSDESGWIPRWRYGQGANECWAFSVLYSVESIVNLYFNRQINDELSVQNLISCINGVVWNQGYHPYKALDYAITDGIVDDNCLEYRSWYIRPCEDMCENPIERVFINGRSNRFSGEINVKTNLITKGPIVTELWPWEHAMSMVGFGVVKAGDPILYGNFNAGTVHDFIVEEDSPDIGKPYYIFKQSYYHYGYNHSHFCNVIIDANHSYYMTCFSIDTPITSMLYDDNDIVCVDNDGDGYYNWGIGPKPATCPNCPDEEDCDDSSPLIGPYDDKYECRILCENYSYSSTPEYITGQTLWGSETYIDHDVIVESGGVLTIENTVYMGESTRIIVKPGGRLILDYRAVLTGMCDSMWQGIEVWGNSTMHQYEVNGSYGQGYVELKNGAVIENAQCAVELWRPNYWSTTGGIIHASDATFRNNKVAVHAICYSNYNPNTHVEVSYNAHFDNCSFVVDGNYKGTQAFKKHVSLTDVSGLKFRGCNFSADRGVNGVDSQCKGISAYNAGFSVNALCSSSNIPCPEEDMDKCTFSGFCAGIKVNSDGISPRSFTVRDAVFTDNDYGIYATNINFLTVLNSDFGIGRGEYCDDNYGICLENVTGFCLEENYFHPSGQSNATTVGIAIYNSNGTNDVYHNTFEDLTRGSLAVGQNTSTSQGQLSPVAGHGLTYTCNENDGNLCDFMVLQENGVGDIQSQQGSSAMPAGNTFIGRGFQFYNEGSQQIDYYYNSNNIDETPNTALLYRVNSHGTTSVNPCYPHYGLGSVVKSASEKAALESAYLSAYTTYSSLRQLYESRIDGGSTATQVADINTATPADMWQLRAQLLGLSPYVSGQVLTTAADRNDVFTDPVLFEILAANPDELKNDSLIAYLESKTNPLPGYMVELLRQIATGISSRTALVAQMGKYGHDYTLAAGDIVRSNLNDSVANPTELRNWLGSMNDIAADRMAISSYLQEGDSASAFTLANMLPDLYGLQGTGLADHGDYLRLLNLYQTLKSSNRTVYEMTEAEITMVEGIADTGTGVSKSMAESLITEITDGDRITCLAPDLPDPEEGGSDRGTFTNTPINEAFGFRVSVRPNPATTWATVDYTLPVKAAKATLTVTNTMGVKVLSTELEGTQGNKVLDLRGLSAGVYGYTVRCGGNVKTGKLVVTK